MDEFEVIQKHFSDLGVDPHALDKTLYLGSGDDCAVIRSGDRLQTLCTDTMVKGVHFPTTHIEYFCLGYKLVAVNVSDTLSMGALPRWALLSLSVQADFDFPVFAQGVKQACKDYGIGLIGGDTTRGKDVLTLTMLGDADAVVKRSGAQVGDAIVVTGALGWAAAGLWAIQQGASNTQSKKAYEAYWQPQPELRWQQWVQSYASACIDVSDGFIQDLNHLLNAAQAVTDQTDRHSAIPQTLGARLERQAFVEYADLQRFADQSKQNAWDWILFGGDDYKLCMTVPQQRLIAFKKLVQSTNGYCQIVGTITRQTGIYLDNDLIQVKGYRHTFN